jgi:hypothetical protein
MTPAPPVLTEAEQDIVLDLPGRRKSGCRLDSKSINDLVHPVTSAPMIEIVRELMRKDLVEQNGGCFRLTNYGERLAQNIAHERKTGKKLSHGSVLRDAAARRATPRSRPRKKNPSSWVTPVAIVLGAGVLVTAAALAVRHYRKINALEPGEPDGPIVEPPQPAT